MSLYLIEMRIVLKNETFLASAITNYISLNIEANDIWRSLLYIPNQIILTISKSHTY